MKELLRRLRLNPKLLTKLLISSFFVNILGLAVPIYVIQVLQRYIAYGVLSTLVTLIIGIIVIVIFEFFFKNIRHRMARELESFNIIMVNSITNKIDNIPASQYVIKDNFRSDALNNDISTVQQTLVGTKYLMVLDVPFVIIFLIALFLLHWTIGIITLLFLIFPFLIYLLFRKKIQDSSRTIKSTAQATYTMIEDLSKKSITVRYFNLRSMLSKFWQQVVYSSMMGREIFESNQNTLNSSLATLGYLLTIIIIGWGAVLAVDGIISVGALIGANILAGKALNPVVRFAQQSETLIKSDTAIDNINQILRMPNENSKGKNEITLNGSIKANDIFIQYPGSKDPVFESLTFTLGSGELLAIKGDNGSGKTSLINILSGILPSSRGSILIDETEINQFNLDWFRKNIIFLPQHPSFVGSDIISNLIGINKIEKSKLEQILEEVDLTSFINSNPNGLKYDMQNHEHSLPFGIKKRIALARALINDGKIVILDEPTEGVDEKGREKINELISKFIKQKKTIIVASHDSQITKDANVIIDLNIKPKPKVIRNI